MNWRRLWVPDAGAVCAALTVLYCLFLFDGWRQLFRDSDSGWHIRTGEWILLHGSLPRVDPYSFGRPGEPWFAWEWGADVLSALAFRFSGMAGVAALYAGLIGFATWLWWRLTWIVEGDFLLAWLFAVPMLSTTNLHWLARPHVFGWCFLLLGLLLAERGRGLPWVALLSAVWTNFHASFFLLPLLFVLYAVGDFVARRVFEKAGEMQSRTRWYLSAAALASFCTLANPYGWGVHVHVFEYLRNTELIDRIGEFQSFNFHVDGAWQILAMVAIAFAGGVLALTQGRIARFLVAALFLVVGLRSARGLPIVALAVLPLANASIANALRSAGGLRAPVQRWLRSAARYSEGLRVLDRGFAGYGLAPLGLCLLAFLSTVPGLQARAGFPQDEFPVAAAAEVAKLPRDARILAPDKYGGFLIYRFAGERQVFFDGRSDYYGSVFMKNYIQLVEVRPNWQVQLENYRFSHALLPNRYSLIPALQREGWRRIYNDEVATLLAR